MNYLLLHVILYKLIMGNTKAANTQLKVQYLIDQYEDLYVLSHEVYKLQHKQQTSPSQQLFTNLFFNFFVLKNKYNWCELIPFYIRKYFYNILGSMHKAEIQAMYKALSSIIFIQKAEAQVGQYQNSFYQRISKQKSSPLKKQIQKTSSLLDQSILFQDEVINIYQQRQKNVINPENLFRSSILNIDSLFKPQNNAIVMKQAIFIQNLPEKSQIQLSFLIQFYKRFAMVIESLINSASFISLPIRHFELSMRQKKKKKKLQGIPDIQINISCKLFQENEQGQERRRVQKFNQALLLQQISCFTEVYTQFIWAFYNLEKINETQYSKLINYQNIKNLMTNVVWSRCEWVGDRSWEYQQYLLELYLLSCGIPPGSPNINQKILSISMNLPTTPIRYLKQIVIVYRQMLKISKQMTADDLMLAYNRLFYELALKKKIRRLLRMIQIVNTLWKGEKFGEVGYAWITWQASLELLLKQAKKYKLRQLDKKVKKLTKIGL